MLSTSGDMSKKKCLVAKLFILKLFPVLNHFSGQTHTLTHTHDRDIGLPSGIRDSSSLARQVL